MSVLIHALRDYAVQNARAYYEEHLFQTYCAPCLATWDAFAWFEVVQDWELVDFLTSGTVKADRLLRSLQACLQWYGQTEIDDILARMDTARIRN
ncbi:MAG TPA: hypothetical protein VFG09_06540 [Thermodesulfovibrionales bacterium]|nr:hypothetical protein [Thermodesulfovibrionales bacterium]